MNRIRKVRPTPELVQARPELDGRVGYELPGGNEEGILVEWEGLSRLYRVPEPLVDTAGRHAGGKGAA